MSDTIHNQEQESKNLKPPPFRFAAQCSDCGAEFVYTADDVTATLAAYKAWDTAHNDWHRQAGGR